EAGDGIRDGTVTGVQTCALPIYFCEVTFHGGESGHHRFWARRLDGGDLRGPGQSRAAGFRRGGHPTERHARDAASRTVEPDYRGDRKSTRLNSSHRTISYAVLCL